MAEVRGQGLVAGPGPEHHQDRIAGREPVRHEGKGNHHEQDGDEPEKPAERVAEHGPSAAGQDAAGNSHAAVGAESTRRTNSQATLPFS